MVDKGFGIRRLALTVAAGAGAVVLLAACGGGDSTAGSDMSATGAPAATATTEQPGAAFNDADVTFAQMMIPHHEQAVEMAELAETRAADAEIKDLAARIKAAQDPEIATLRGWLKAWGKPEMADHMGHDMPGMMGEGDMHNLGAAKGTEFDRLFARLMIAHHNGAIEMARTEQAQGANPEAKALAKTIETTQQAEVEQLQKILDRL
ncbi:DUF305 domain-containing protein [Thermoactinospora rubra]|uniref:DUF305 domain-containing protein n=1 Tax=Thermoactinospora rubra TaxID=1088767 RepID=UPI000A106342|nr:DUF305 domain-containing protein [Thermoactinospora rubra]